MTATPVTCAICMDDMELTGAGGRSVPVMTPECGHGYHLACALSYCARTCGAVFCPLCRVVWHNISDDVPTSPSAAPVADGMSWRLSALERSLLPTDHGCVSLASSLSRDDRPSGSSRCSAHALSRLRDVQVTARVDAGASSTAQPGDLTAVVSVNVVSTRHEVSPSPSPSSTASASSFASSSDLRPPMDLVLLVDISEAPDDAMSAIFTEALAVALDNTTPRDRVCFMIFGSEAYMWSSWRRSSELELELRRGCARSLCADASGGIVRAALWKAEDVLQARGSQISSSTGVILLSNGRSSDHEGSRAVDAARRVVGNLGACVHVLGYGAGHDAPLLSTLAHEGGGTFTYVDSAETVRVSFGSIAACVMGMAAQRVALTVAIPPVYEVAGVTDAHSARPLSYNLTEGSVSIPLGALREGEQRDVAVALRVRPPPTAVCLRCFHTTAAVTDTAAAAAAPHPASDILRASVGFVWTHAVDVPCVRDMSVSLPPPHPLTTVSLRIAEARVCALVSQAVSHLADDIASGRTIDAEAVVATVTAGLRAEMGRLLAPGNTGTAAGMDPALSSRSYAPMGVVEAMQSWDTAAIAAAAVITLDVTVPVAIVGTTPIVVDGGGVDVSYASSSPYEHPPHLHAHGVQRAFPSWTCDVDALIGATSDMTITDGRNSVDTSPWPSAAPHPAADGLTSQGQRPRKRVRLNDDANSP